MVQRLKCLFGRHQPSRRRARQTSDGTVSICKGCGRSMTKGPRGWVAA